MATWDMPLSNRNQEGKSWNAIDIATNHSGGALKPKEDKKGSTSKPSHHTDYNLKHCSSHTQADYA